MGKWQSTRSESARMLLKPGKRPDRQFSESTSTLCDGESTPKQSSHSPSPKFAREEPGFTSTITDIICVLCPLGLLIFTIALICHNGRTIDATYTTFENIITTLATFFPVLFAAIIGRLMFQISRWKLERGATIGTLEQLMGSRTLGGTLFTHAELRSVNLLGLLLIFIWAWSPLGGQALLRMLHSRLETVLQPSEIDHFNTDSTPMFAWWSVDANYSKKAVRDTIALQDSMYNAALLTPDSIQKESQDIWGNLKIPYLASYGSLDDPNWQRVPSQSQFEYSALVGIPLAGISAGNTSFTVESNYVYLKCSNITKTKWDGQNNTSQIYLNDTAVRQTTFPYSRAYSVPNGTWQGYQLDGSEWYSSWNLGIDTLTDPNWSSYEFRLNHSLNAVISDRPSVFVNETGIEARPTTLLLQVSDNSNGQTRPNNISAYCGVTQNYVESRVNCSLDGDDARRDCAVVEQRPSRKRHATENISALSFPRVFNLISLLLPQATHHSTSVISLDPSLRYLQTPSIVDIGSPVEPLELEDVLEDKFSHRLGQLINSYLLINQAFPGVLAGSMKGGWIDPNISVPVDVETIVEVYDISRAWSTICVFSCLVFLAGGVLSVVFIRLADGPDVLGFVSTAVRDSKHIDMSTDAARMNGHDLTMRMREVRIRFGYIKNAAEGRDLLGVGREETVTEIKGGMW